MPFGVGIRLKGERFDATDAEARILLALNRAKVYEPSKAEEVPKDSVQKDAGYSRRDMKPQK